MSEGGGEHAVGIVGVGRLGAVLARRLRERRPVLVDDVRPEAVKRACALSGARAGSLAEMGSTCELVLLCIPARATEEVLRRAAACGLARPIYACIATDFAVEPLAAELSALTIVGLKLVGQFTAIDHGLRVLFVTACDHPAVNARVREILVDVGTVVTGPEGAVRALNRAATEAALRFGEALTTELARTGAPGVWIDAAIKSVAVGTLLDYPPEPDNSYTSTILAAIRASCP